ncbi:MAG: S8 family serine peptidase [Phycisphaerales bacterium]|nr:MAG: S8 family serine peptidase [Phycisphaerales bacterium]
MIQTGVRVLRFGFLACLTVLFSATSGAVRAADFDGVELLQPQGLNQAGIYALRQMDPSLTGSGVKFAVICRSYMYDGGNFPRNDYRPNTSHSCLGSAQFSFSDCFDTPAEVSPHSTAICSILFGEDRDAFSSQLGNFIYQGAAPAAEADLYEFWHFLISKVHTHADPAVDIVTAGIGTQFEDWWTRGIESLAEHYGVVVVAAIGNGSNAYHPPLYPGAGANAIGVGVVNSVNTQNIATNLAHFSLAYPQHSTIGPTTDGRCKPDIIAPGNCLAASADDPALYELTGNWSSFSTPVVAGAAGLLVQKAKQDAGLALAVSPDGGNCVIKAILMNSAKKLPYWHRGQLETADDHVAPLDYVQGAGMLNAVGAYRQLTAGRGEPGDVSPTGWDLNRLGRDAALANVYRITVEEPAGKCITATVVWNRHYSRVPPFDPLPEKDGNLRLDLWVVEPDTSAEDPRRDYSDSEVDNVEHIHFHCRTVAAHATYELVVSYSDLEGALPADGSLRYAVAWHVGVSQGSDNIFWHDVNGDGVVDERDIAVVLDNHRAGVESPESYQIGDVNTDGTIDVSDLQILLDNRNRQADWLADGESK